MTANLQGHVDRAISAGERTVALDTAMIAKLTDIVGAFAVNILIAGAILAATLLAARWASGGARRALGRVHAFQTDPTVLSFAVQVVRVVVILIGLIAVLQRLGVQTASIIAVLGAASLALGLALQGTLSNVAAGVMLLILRPYRVGDVVDIGGKVGSVRRLDLFTTELFNASNHKIVVPNGQVLGDVVVNLSGQERRRVEIDFGVGYSEDINMARAALMSAATAHPIVLDEPLPWTGVTGLLDSAVQITMHAWVPVAEWWQVKADLMQAGKEALDAAGIEIPFPHQVAVPYTKGGEVQLPDDIEGAPALHAVSDEVVAMAHRDIGDADRDTDSG